MGKIKSLAGDTLVYGVSTVLGRFLNWLLMPLYVNTMPEEEYGVVVLVYSAIALLLVVVTLGFETAYFRYVNDDNKNTLLSSLSTTVLLFGILVTLLLVIFKDTFNFLFGFPSCGLSLLIYTGILVLLDSYNAIYFANLRYSRQSLKYSILRLVQVVVTVVFTIFFLCYLNDKTLFGFDFSSISSISYILFANVLGSLVPTLYFLPLILRVKFSVDIKQLRTILLYSLPLVAMGFFGTLNQHIEKRMLPELLTTDRPMLEVAIYGANYKIGILMAIFTQSFRIAFEPFFFREAKKNGAKDISGDALKYFVYFGLFVFSSVTIFSPVIQNMIFSGEYLRGRNVITIILLAQLCFGVYYSLSMWYKVIDKTYFGIIMSVVGLICIIISNFLLIPTLGIDGAALSSLIGHFVMMILSFILGNKYYPIKYPFMNIIGCTLSVLAIVGLNYHFDSLISSIICFFSSIFVILLFERKIISFVYGKVRDKSYK